MNVLTPDIQSNLLKAARRMPVSLLFTGGDGPRKTLASEVLAAHYEVYPFRVDLSHLLSTTAGETERHLQRIFARVQPSGDLLFFDHADALLPRVGVEGGDATACFLRQLRGWQGVVIVSVNDADNLDPVITEYFTSFIDFPAEKVVRSE